eukprot:6192213-Pleurochrysis_carterae.AAC.6
MTRTGVATSRNAWRLAGCAHVHTCRDASIAAAARAGDAHIRAIGRLFRLSQLHAPAAARRAPAHVPWRVLGGCCCARRRRSRIHARWNDGLDLHHPTLRRPRAATH